MHYYSTKNRHQAYSLKEAVLLGLPEDNGLFMPERIPLLPSSFLSSLSKRSLSDIAFEVSKAWFGSDIPEEELKRMVESAYDFDTPLVSLLADTSVLELFHGPTLAFKDVGARFMARLMSWLVRGQDRKLTILVATSGDTGSAVASGFFGMDNIDVIILYPSGKVSLSQEKQLTTWGGNIRALEVKGTFDDCQRMVKEAFLDPQLRSDFDLTSANSINIARLVPQSFYYFRAVAQLDDLDSSRVCFVVPSGNFGNLTAGLLAQRMGLSVDQFIAATNANDVVPQYLSHGQFQPRPSIATRSNAMDVGNPSNFWRMTALFGDSRDTMKQAILGIGVSEEETLQAMKHCYQETGYIMDPHGAVGLHAWSQLKPACKGARGIILETAHPSKFSDVVKEAIGFVPEMPDRLKAIVEKTKLSTLAEPRLESLKDFLFSRSR